MAAVDAEGLVKVYRSRKSEVRALDGVELDVQEGTVLGLGVLVVFAPLAVRKYRSIDR
jgi:hypothetical protein